MDTIPDRVFFYKDQIIYQSAYTQLFHSPKGEIIGQEYRYRTFVYTAGHKYGYLFDSLAKKFNAKTDVDSLFNSDWYFNSPKNPNLSKETSTLVSSAYDSLNAILVKTYSLKGKKDIITGVIDTTLSGSCTLWYSSKFKNINYSISKELDSIKNMKLYKVKTITNERYLKDYDITLDRVELTDFMEECSFENESEILSYFKIGKK
jgi:hypothetical protein